MPCFAAKQRASTRQRCMRISTRKAELTATPPAAIHRRCCSGRQREPCSRCYTDGLTEATSPEGVQHAHLSADQFAGRLLQEALAWPGSDNNRLQSDDITIVVIDAQR